MSTARQYREERAGIISQMNDLASQVKGESRSFSSEELNKYDQFDAAQKELLGKAETLERIESCPTVNLDTDKDKKFSVGSNVTREDVNLAFAAWAGGEHGLDLSDRHYRACEKLGVNTRNQKFKLNLGNPDTFAQTVTTSAGGYTIQNEALRPLEVALKAFGGIRNIADVIRTSTGANLPFPTVNDTSNKGAILAINTQIAGQDITFGQTVLGSYKYTSKLVLVPMELMQDSAVNLPEYIGSALGERLGRITNEHYTTGDGSSKPRGILADTTAGKTCADDVTFTWKEVLDLIHSVDPAYRNKPGVGLHMSDAVWAYLKTFVDGQARPLWIPSLAVGAPDTFLGYPVYLNNEMPSTIEASAKVMTFGDHKSFKIRDVSEVEIIRLNERYADYHQVGFVGVMRTDSALVPGSSNGAVKHMVMAAS